MLGLVMVLSASATVESAKGNSPYSIFNRQLTWAVIGLAGLLVGARLRPVLGAPVRPSRGLVVGIAAMMLPFVPGLGVTLNDARAWITFGDFSVQPSEFLKLAVVVFAADLLVRRRDEIVRRTTQPAPDRRAGRGRGRRLPGTGRPRIGHRDVCDRARRCLHRRRAAVTDAGDRRAGRRSLPSGSSSRAPSATQRFTAFLDITGHRDELSYQTYQGFLSIADGGLTGSGVGAGNGKLGYLPLAHSDFIFAVIADELGLVGAVAVVGGFMLLAWFGVQAALAAPDRFGMLLAGGITAWFGAQAVINLGGVTGLMPVTGSDPAVLLRRWVVAVRLDDRRRAAAQRRPSAALKRPAKALERPPCRTGSSPFTMRPPKRLEAPACRSAWVVTALTTAADRVTMRPPKRLEAPACRTGSSPNTFTMRPPKRLEAPACRTGSSPFTMRPPKRLEAPACRTGSSPLKDTIDCEAARSERIRAPSPLLA